MIRLFTLLLATTVILSCEQRTEKSTSEMSKTWALAMHLHDSVTLPFQLTIEAETKVFTIQNGEELIQLDASYQSHDSLVLDFPVYQSRLCLKLKDGQIKGYFEKTDTEGYLIPINTVVQIFDEHESPCCTLASRYEVSFFQDDRVIPAIGEFSVEANQLKGTFYTNAGDYRYLHGTFSGNKIFFTGFDGGYVQVFSAKVKNDTLLGHYWSGLTLYRRWQGIVNGEVRLDDADKLTELNPAYDSIAFTYPAISGGDITYNPARFAEQVVLLQITGSWCPNCKDQALYLDQLQKKHRENIALIGLAFERMGSLEKSIAAAKKAKQDLGVTYPVAIAQYSSRQKATEQFPFLDGIRAYPTLIIIDKKGEVRKIYTGFSGPGTADYKQVVQELSAFIQALIDE